MKPAALLLALFLMPSRAAAQGKKDAESALKESGIELALGDVEAARLLASQAVELDSANPRGYLQRASVELQLRAFDQAVKDANKAVALGFRKASVFNVRSEALAAQGLYERALADAEIAVLANPSGAAGYLNRASAREGLSGLTEDVLADYRRASELDARQKSRYEKALAAAARKAAPKPEPATPPSAPRRGSHFRAIALGALGIVVFALLALDWRRRRSRTVRFGSVITLPPEADAPRPGSVVGGRFIVGCKLPNELEAEAFEARDLSDSPLSLRRYALPRDAARRGACLERARLAASMRHPNVETVEAVIDDGDRFLAACLPLPGQPLHALTARLPQRRLPADQMLRVLKGACDALDAAHAKGLAHGALSASRVFVQRAEIVVADFVAPRLDAKPAEDLFALACLLYETLAGQNPFPGPDAAQQKREGLFAPASQAIPGAPGGLDDFFARALNPEPERRFRTASELFVAFRSLVVPLVQ